MMYITQGLKRAVQVNGSGIATIDGERQRTWREFAQRVEKLAGALKNLGLKEGDRLAVLALNSDRYLECFFAVPWAGGIIVPLNTRLAVPELVYMLNDTAPEILVVDDAFAALSATLADEVPSLKHIILAGDGPIPAGAVSHDEILATADPIPDAQRGGDDIAAIYYTGGTTGLSKGVMLTHNNIVSNAMSGMAHLYRGEPWIYLHSAAMFHIADSQWNSGVTMQAGTHVFIPKFDPVETLKTIEKHRVTYCAVVPIMINLLYMAAEKTNYDVSSLRDVEYGGSPMSPAVVAQAKAVFPNCRFNQGYGQTETSPGISRLPPQYHTADGPYADKLASAGLVVLNMELKIVDPDDNEVPPGALGEIVVRGPHVMAGYWNKPEETAQALRGGWMHTGDAGYIDEDGFLFIVDRVKDMIVTGAENVYSSEVENAIYHHPAVALCAVIGVPDEKWGERVHAVVTLKEGQSLTEEEIIDHCRKYIGGYKCPRSVEIRTEPMPMSGAGKILKRELRAPYWAGHNSQVN
jgi:long-chain acyl-CoA synthetase